MGIFSGSDIAVIPVDEMDMCKRNSQFQFSISRNVSLLCVCPFNQRFAPSSEVFFQSPIVY